MKRIYVLPNFITAFGLACGLFVIFKVNMIVPGGGYYNVIKTSALFLLVAAFADFIDGAVARVLHAESEFGCMFDSLADAVSFGVAPSVLLLKSLSLQQGTYLSFIVATGALVYSLCGILRLARFTTQAREAKGNIIKVSAMKKNFTGLPIPAAAAGSISVNLFLLSPFAAGISITQTTRSVFLSVVMVVLGYLMVSRWKFPSLKSFNFRVKSFHLAFLTVILASFMLYGALYYFSIALMLISWGYIALAMVLAVVRKVAFRKSKTLEDFEPEKEEDSK